MIVSEPRLYEPIWIKLKAEGIASLTANRRLHARIIKAVIKEKWLDTGYKLQIYPWRSKLTYSTQHAVITFYLTKTLNMEAVTPNDL